MTRERDRRRKERRERKEKERGGIERGERKGQIEGIEWEE